MDEVEVTRNGRTDQFSIILVRGADTIRCMVSVALGGAPDTRSDSVKPGQNAQVSDGFALHV